MITCCSACCIICSRTKVPVMVNQVQWRIIMCSLFPRACSLSSSNVSRRCPGTLARPQCCACFMQRRKIAGQVHVDTDSADAWTRVQSSDGRWYWYNKFTSDTQWRTPAAVAAAENAVLPITVCEQVVRNCGAHEQAKRPDCVSVYPSVWSPSSLPMCCPSVVCMFAWRAGRRRAMRNGLRNTKCHSKHQKYHNIKIHFACCTLMFRQS